MADELPRVRQQQQGEAGAGGLVDIGAGTGPGYTETMMDSEIQRVSRELYKAFSGKNPGFAEVSYSHYLQLNSNSSNILLFSQGKGPDRD